MNTIIKKIGCLVICCFTQLHAQPPKMLPKVDAFKQLSDYGLIRNNGALRLHLGCGQNYLSGYINIDYPPDEHTVQDYSVADVFGEITCICFPNESVQEVRLHHVFEHFDRPTALALLCAWCQWLAIGGTLCIEVPDLTTSIQMILSTQYSYDQKQVIMRHIFGSHEARWAIHCDGWYKERFEHVLGKLGLTDITVSFSSWMLTHNITVSAKKNCQLDKEELVHAAYQLLRENMVDKGISEEKMWKVWCGNFDDILGCLLV